MDIIKLTGTIVEKFNEVQISEKFKKREFIIETQEQYPQEISIQLTQDQCSLIDAFAEGQLVDVCVNIRGRRWESPSGETKWFNTIQAWRIDAFDGFKKANKVSDYKAKVGGIEQNFVEEQLNDQLNEEEDDDLPF